MNKTQLAIISDTINLKGTSAMNMKHIKDALRYSEYTFKDYGIPFAMVAVWRRSKSGDKQSVVLLEYQSEMSIVRIN